MVTIPARPAPPMSAHPRPRLLRARLLLIVSAAACGEQATSSGVAPPAAPDGGSGPAVAASAPPPPAAPTGPRREVLPATSEHADSTPVPEVDDDLAHEALAARQHWGVAFGVEPGVTYQVVLRYEGAEPVLWYGPSEGGEPAALRPVQVVSSSPGRLEGLMSPDAAHARLEVRAFRGALALEHLSVRHWGRDHLSGAKPEPGQVVRLQVGRDTRPAILLPSTSTFTLPLEIPRHATRLALAVAPAADSQGDGGTIRVIWMQPGKPARKLVREPVGRSLTHWREVLVDVQHLAGQRGELGFEILDADPDARTVMSVPELLCERGRSRPNLVLVSIDTLRADRLDLYGNPRVTAPRLRRLAARGAVFEQALSVSAYTLPSHTTLFSGMHPLGHGVAHPGHAIDSERVPLLADLLRRQGYATRAFTGSGYVSADYGFARGFAAYGEYDPVRPLTASEMAWVESNATRSTGLAAMLAAQSWDAALDWVEQRRELPFFLFLQTFVVHDYRPELRDRERFGAPPEGEGVEPLRSHLDQQGQPYDATELAQLRDLYDGAIATADRRLGELIDRLDALGLSEHTIVVVTSDHGETIGEHGFGGNPQVGHAFGLWNEQVAIPLVLVAPGIAPQQRREPVTLLDVAPTLLDLLGLPRHPAMQGVSLRPLLEGRADAPRPSPALLDLLSLTSQSRALYSDGLKLVLGDPDAPVTQPVSTPAALYDRRSDPGETHDLAAEQPAAVARLRAQLEALVQHYSATGADAPSVELSEDTLRALAELGYVER